MTSYYLRITPKKLRKLASTQLVIEICRQICMIILLHFQDTVLRHDPEARQKVLDQNFTLQWCLGLLKGSATDLSETDYPLMVHYIDVQRQTRCRQLSFRRRIALHELSQVPDEILILIMARLIEDCLISVYPEVSRIPAAQLANCMRVLQTIPRKVSGINQLRLHGRPGRVRVCVLVESLDQINERRSFT